MTNLHDEGERLVAAAKPRFKDFRVDFEKISTAASGAARESRDGLDPATASHWFHDFDWHLRLPLQRRYAEADAFEAIVKYHMVRFKNYLGRNVPWPDAPASETLALFARHGRADLGVALIRSYGDMQYKRLLRDLPKRNPRGPHKELDEGVTRAIGVLDRAIADAIPARKADLLRDFGTVQPYIAENGRDEDRAWLDTLRREIWMERRA